ncbi:MAG TPA: sigma-70 family RNA polymerase sigma factor [Bryobacteraceae bacterium]|jgi:RNA polymerase sigma-70 factor (ECF subfamily)
MKTLALAAVEAGEEPEGRDSALEAARAGDRAAFDLLMRRHERLVLGTAYRLAGNLEDAQDASQEVFLRLYRNLGKIEAGNLAAWLYRVTVNVCHDARRRRLSTVPVEDAAELADGGDPQQSASEAERRALLLRSLRMLSERERAALVLRDLEGLSTAEVAGVLGSSVVTVRSQISKARLKMRDFVERYSRRRL